MDRLFYIFLVWIVPVMHLQAQSNVNSAAPDRADTPKIAVTKLDATSTAVRNFSHSIITTLVAAASF